MESWPRQKAATEVFKNKHKTKKDNILQGITKKTHPKRDHSKTMYLRALTKKKRNCTLKRWATKTTKISRTGLCSEVCLYTKQILRLTFSTHYIISAF